MICLSKISCLYSQVYSKFEKYLNTKILLDAGALRVVDKKLLHKNCVLTPHVKEFEQLFGIKPNFKNLVANPLLLMPFFKIMDLFLNYDLGFGYIVVAKKK